MFKQKLGNLKSMLVKNILINRECIWFFHAISCFEKNIRLLVVHGIHPLPLLLHLADGTQIVSLASTWEPGTSQGASVVKLSPVGN